MLSIVGLILVAGCAEPQKMEPVTPAAPTLQINPAMVRVTKNEPPPGCKELGSVTAGMVFSYDGALASLRQKTAELGGDWLTLDMPTVGRVFFCPPDVVNAYDAARNPNAPPPPAAAAPYSILCEPDCSPGFACVRGQCVEACNPKCVLPARCGADRICH